METNGVKKPLNPLNCWDREQGLKRNSSDLNRFYSRSFPAGGADICRKHQAGKVSGSRHYLPLWMKYSLVKSQCHAGYSVWRSDKTCGASHAKCYITLPRQAVFQLTQIRKPSPICSDRELEGGNRKKRKVHLRMCGRKMWGKRI